MFIYFFLLLLYKKVNLNYDLYIKILLWGRTLSFVMRLILTNHTSHSINPNILMFPHIVYSKVFLTIFPKIKGKICSDAHKV